MTIDLRGRPHGLARLLTFACAIAITAATAPIRANYVPDAIDSVTIPDSVAFPLARQFLDIRGNDCVIIPGAIVGLSGKGNCTHPLDKYIIRQNDSVVIYGNGRPMLAAYRSFRHVTQNKRSFNFSHEKFLPYANPAPAVERSWISRQISKLLSWTIMQFFSFIFPALAQLWNSMPSAGKTAVMVVSALLMLVFLVFIARALTHSQVLQRRLAPDTLQPINVVRKTDWLAKADLSIRIGEYQKAVSLLYSWFIAWLTDSGRISRREWWTNRQLIAAIKRNRPAIASFARALITIYEDTEYGHREVEADAIQKLRDRIRLEILGGRP